MSESGKADTRKFEFTHARVKAIKPPPPKTIIEDGKEIEKTVQLDYWDAKEGFTGFGLRVNSIIQTPKGQRGGAKTWQLIYRVNGRYRRFKLGKFPQLPLADARAEAGRALREIELGNDPAASKYAARQITRETPTFAALAQAYIEEHASKKKSGPTIERIIKKELLPRFGQRLAPNIERGEIRAAHKAISERAPIMANRVLEVIKSLYSWALTEEFHSSIKINPATGVKKNGERKDTRFLNPNEIAAVWSAMDELEPQWRAFFRLCLLTGQRPGEVLRMRKANLDLDAAWWVMPEDYAKNGIAHSVPLSSLALEALDEALAESDDPDYVFPKRGGGEPDPTNQAWNTSAHTLLEESGVPHFTCDDFRATAITGLSSEPLSFPEVTVAKVANHSNQAITDRYIRHGYDAEKRRALEAWSDRISEIVGIAPMPSNVEQLHAG